MKQLVPAIVIGASVLVGCGEHEPDDDNMTPVDAEQTNLEVAKAINTDNSNVQGILKALQEKDPTILDAHLKGEPGSRVIVVGKLDSDGNIQQMEYPYDKLLAESTAGTQQTASAAPGSGLATMLTAAAIGAAAGYLIANATANRQNWSRPMPPDAYNRERERNRSSYVGSAAGGYRSAYVNSVRSSNAQGGAKSGNVGKSSGGSFRSSGARAGGYSGGGNGG